MKNHLLHKITFVAVVVIMSMTAFAQSFKVSSRLDSTHLLMGNMMMIHFEVVQNESQKVNFPLLNPEGNPAGVVTLCGDSVELRTSVTRDTVRLGSGRIQVNHHVPLQSFDSGYYRLPEFIFVSGSDSVNTSRLGLKVVPVINVTANDSIAPFADVSDAEGKTWLDNVPDFIYYYWWLLLIIAALIFALWKFRNRLKSVKPAVKKVVKPIDPYKEAMDALERLKERKLWEKGLEKEYFTELTDILRTYLYRRFGISAKEMTTGQILNILNNNPETKDKRSLIRRVLDMADFVKFAKMRPLPADNVEAFENSLNFVVQTKPEEPVSQKDIKNDKKQVDSSNNMKGGKE